VDKNLETEKFYFKKLAKNKLDCNFLEYPLPNARNSIIADNHNLGHFQAELTQMRIEERYYWKSLNKDVIKFIKKCEPCKREHKVTAFNHPAIANKINGIFEKIAMDLTFGFPQTVDGYVGFLTIVEYLSGYVYTQPIKTKTAKETCEHVWRYFCTFGVPRIILSDQGNEFNNSLLNGLLEKIKVKHIMTSAFSPRVDGKCERYNYLIAEALRVCIDHEPDKSKWVSYLDFVSLAFNSKVHTRTGFTPYEIVFGRKMFTFFSTPINFETCSVKDFANRVNEIKDQYEGTHVEALDKIKKSQIDQKNQQNKNQQIQIERLEIGSWVMVLARGMLNKTDPRYKGPYKILKQTINGSYILRIRMEWKFQTPFPYATLKKLKKIITILTIVLM
jgi:hypothetical protein